VHCIVHTTSTTAGQFFQVADGYVGSTMQTFVNYRNRTFTSWIHFSSANKQLKALKGADNNFTLRHDVISFLFEFAYCIFRYEMFLNVIFMFTLLIKTVLTVH